MSEVSPTSAKYLRAVSVRVAALSAVSGNANVKLFLLPGETPHFHWGPILTRRALIWLDMILLWPDGHRHYARLHVHNCLVYMNEYIM